MWLLLLLPSSFHVRGQEEGIVVVVEELADDIDSVGSVPSLSRRTFTHTHMGTGAREEGRGGEIKCE